MPTSKKHRKAKAKRQILLVEKAEVNSNDGDRSIEKYQKGSLSLRFAEEQKKAIFSLFDIHIEQLRQSMTSEAKKDAKDIEKTYEVLKKIDKRVQEIAKEIARQNKKSLSIAQGVKSIGNGDGLKGKVRATADLVSMVLDKVPIVSQVKSYASCVVHGRLYLHSELDRQYRSAMNLKTRLDTLLYGDKGLQTLRERISKEIRDYTEQLIELKKDSEEKLGKIDELQIEKGELVSELEKEHKKKYDEINPGTISSKNLGTYAKVHSTDDKIMELEGDTAEIRKKCEITGNYIQGKRTIMGVYITYFLQGEQIFQKIEGFLEACLSDIDASEKISQFESIMIEAATIVHNLMDNYNRVILTHSENAVDLAENSKHLVPDRLHKPDTMIKTVQNVKKALETHFKNDPVGTAKQIGTALGAERALPTTIYDRPALTDGVNGDSEKPYKQE